MVVCSKVIRLLDSVLSARAVRPGGKVGQQGQATDAPGPGAANRPRTGMKDTTRHLRMTMILTWVWISNMRLTTEQKAEIARLKRSGVGYRTIANKMGLKPSTVSSFCQRSGLFADNPAHKVLFTIPEARFSNVPALTKALPPQKVITGHKQTDAYLWVLEVIKLNEPAHLDAAEVALEKLPLAQKT